MKNIQRSALLPYSAEQMFTLVDDITSYPQFVPYCHSARELKRESSLVVASLEVAKSGIAKSFTTENRLDKPASIRMNLVDGPFKHLSGNWNFIALDKAACRIELDLSFEFKNKLTALAFSAIFEQLVQSMVKAFADRAREVYGASA